MPAAEARLRHGGSKKPNEHYTNINLSNISGETVTVFVKIVDTDGNNYTEDSELGTNIAISGFTGDPLSSGGATLDAPKGGKLTILATGTQRHDEGKLPP